MPERRDILRRWHDIKKRCYNEKTNGYEYYGAKGVRVCDEWLNSFESFYRWSVDNGFKKELNIDRIDGSKGYSPDNCRFVTPKENHNNRKSNTIVSYDGNDYTVSQFADYLGVSYMTVLNRLLRGWTVDECATGSRKNKKTHRAKRTKEGGKWSPAVFTHNGEARTIKQWADYIGVPASTLSDRLKRKTISEAIDMGVRKS